MCNATFVQHIFFFFCYLQASLLKQMMSEAFVAITTRGWSLGVFDPFYGLFFLQYFFAVFRRLHVHSRADDKSTHRSLI